MNLGFACVESGMCRAKNCVNILSKNFIVFAVTSNGFLLLGWGIIWLFVRLVRRMSGRPRSGRLSAPTTPPAAPATPPA
jgi:ammonia channel protein AmtB